MFDRARWFISPEELTRRLGEDIVVVDGSWHLPGSNRSGRAEYEAAHIPGAVFFDIDAVADTNNPLPHMLPFPDAFAAAVGALGIDETQPIIVYDSVGLGSAPRVWWTFKVMGARDVRILDGGLPAWRAAGSPLDADPVHRQRRTFHAAFDQQGVAALAAVQRNLTTPLFQVVDARPAARFRGAAPEPRPNVRSGHIPGSRNVPAGDLVVNGRLIDAAALRQMFDSVGVDLQKPVVTSCGSGVTAATLSLALDVLGAKDVALYDGSWTEWGGRTDTPVTEGD